MRILLSCFNSALRRQKPCPALLTTSDHFSSLEHIPARSWPIGREERSSLAKQSPPSILSISLLEITNGFNLKSRFDELNRRLIGFEGKKFNLGVVMEQQSQTSDPNGPILCVNNCGFFGSASTNNLCSKCYRDFFLKQSKSLDFSVVVEKEEMVEEPVGAVRQVLELVDREEGGSSEDPEKRRANRCSFCKKRVGLTGVKCRCGDTFCFVHRYSDKHNCTFDYKSAGQDAIAKANPIVKADKVEKI